MTDFLIYTEEDFKTVHKIVVDAVKGKVGVFVFLLDVLLQTAID